MAESEKHTCKTENGISKLHPYDVDLTMYDMRTERRNHQKYEEIDDDDLLLMMKVVGHSVSSMLAETQE